MGESKSNKETADSKAPESRQTAPEPPWATLLKELGAKALTAIFAAGSLIAFVAFAGGIVVWTRFYALELPPDQIVDAVPQGESVVVGAAILLVFGIIGALAVAAIYLIDRGGRPTAGMSRGLLLIVGLEAVIAILFAEDAGNEGQLLSIEVVLLATGVALWATYVGGLVRFNLHSLRSRKPGEPVRMPLGTPFFEDPESGKCGVAPLELLVGILAAIATAASAGLVAAGADSSPEQVWAIALGAFGLVLALAVALKWALFYLKDAEARRQERLERERFEAQQDAQEEAGKTEAQTTQPAPTPAPTPSCARLRDALRRAADRSRFSVKARNGSNVSVAITIPGGGTGEGSEKEVVGERPRRRPPRIEPTALGALLLASVALVAVAVPAAILDEAWLLASLASAVVIGLGLWRIAGLVNRFLWFGLAVFLSVPLFGTVALATRNLDDPQAQPVALIRKGDGPAEALQGLYVTESEDRVYFANVATERCGGKLVPNSGRLLWVPKEEVVAMSIGPQQDVKEAGRAAQEMANELTPDIETPTGENVTQRTDGGEREASEEADAEAEAEAEEGEPDHRLETAGLAVRSQFGQGLELDPRVAVPGEKVKLKLTSPAPDEEGDEEAGFGSEERVLRLNGVKIDVEKWSRKEIMFEVPENATSGVVTVECEALAGQPYLTVSREPTARISVKMKPGSNRVSFDGRRSSDDGKIVKWEWTIGNLPYGDGKEKITRSLPPRTRFYRIGLTVTDAEDETDEAVVWLLRPRAPKFEFDRDTPESRRILNDVLKAVSRAAARDRREAKREAKDDKGDWKESLMPPAMIEIAGHADDVGTSDYNAKLSWRRALSLWRAIDDKDVGKVWALAGEPPRLKIRGFGETCPLDPGGGRLRKNRRVEMVVLSRGARMVFPQSCRTIHLKRAIWGEMPP